MFERIGKESRLEYIIESGITGSPSNIVESVQEIVRSIASDLPGGERFIHAIDVYEV